MVSVVRAVVTAVRPQRYDHLRAAVCGRPATHEEVKDPYYTWYNDEAACRRILAEFGLPGTSHIVNGHVPVREKNGESPSRAAVVWW